MNAFQTPLAGIKIIVNVYFILNEIHIAKIYAQLTLWSII